MEEWADYDQFLFDKWLKDKYGENEEDMENRLRDEGIDKYELERVNDELFAEFVYETTSIG